MSVIWASPVAKTTKHGNISVVAVSDSTTSIPEMYYRFCLASTRYPGQKSVFLPYNAASRLWSRFSMCTELLNLMNDDSYLTVPLPLYYDTMRHKMPGERCDTFLEALISTLTEHLWLPRQEYSWMAPSSVYRLWWHTSSVATELFADSFRESGVLRDYCGLRRNDSVFGSLGSWEEVDDVVEGGAGVPPLRTEVLSRVLECCERNVQSMKPYCRCVVLPLESHRIVRDRLDRLTSNGFLLASAPPGCFPLRRAPYRFSTDTEDNNQTVQLAMGVYVWVNREYLLKYPPPLDVEVLYQIWVDKSLNNAEQVVVHSETFLKAFPLELRRADTAAANLLAELE